MHKSGVTLAYSSDHITALAKYGSIRANVRIVPDSERPAGVVQSFVIAQLTQCRAM